MSETKFRVESDLIGELQVPIDAYYGVQTQRAINNYKISNTRMCDYPEYIIAMEETPSSPPAKRLWPANCGTSSPWT